MPWKEAKDSREAPFRTKAEKRLTVGSHIKRLVAFEFFLAPVVALTFEVRLLGLEPSEAQVCATSSSYWNWSGRPPIFGTDCGWETLKENYHERY